MIVRNAAVITRVPSGILNVWDTHVTPLRHLRNVLRIQAHFTSLAPQKPSHIQVIDINHIQWRPRFFLHEIELLRFSSNFLLSNSSLFCLSSYEKKWKHANPVPKTKNVLTHHTSHIIVIFSEVCCLSSHSLWDMNTASSSRSLQWTDGRLNHHSLQLLLLVAHQLRRPYSLSSPTPTR